MALNAASKLGKVIGKLSSEQDDIKSNMSADETEAQQQLYNQEEVVVEGTLTAYSLTPESLAFIADHPVYGELNSDTLYLNSDWVLAFPTTDVTNYWKFDGDATDTVGSSDGTVDGATYTTSGKINGCYDFNGTSDNIELDDDLLDTYSAGSISLWFTIDETTDRHDLFTATSTASTKPALQIVANNSGDNKVGYIFRDDDKNNLAVIYGSTTLTTGTFYHLVITSDGSTIKIYVNGNEETLTVSSGTNTGDWFGDLGSTYTHCYYIGMSNQEDTPSNWHDGKIDEIGIWSRAITQTEITDIYNSGTGKQYATGYDKTQLYTTTF